MTGRWLRAFLAASHWALQHLLNNVEHSGTDAGACSGLQGEFNLPAAAQHLRVHHLQRILGGVQHHLI